MKICLLFPPHWTPTMPHLALPWLTGFLRQNGHSVLQRDLNVEFFDEVLTSPHLRRSIRRIQRRFGEPGSRQEQTRLSSGTAHSSRPQEEQLRWAFAQGPALAEEVESAKGVLRSKKFYDDEASRPALITIIDAMELVSLAHFPAWIELTGFKDPVLPDASGELLKAASNTEINPYFDIFQRGILSDLKREHPDLVGISIPTQGQMLAGITLAALIRQAGLKCHITAGGPHISMLREQLPTAPGLFELFDSFVIFDGELPLLRLAEALEGKGDLSKVPNLIYRLTGKGINTNPVLPIGEVRQAQQTITPDFDGLMLELYLTPELILPLVTAHGCYHGKCGFCNVGYGSPFHYYPYPIEQVTRQIQSVYEKHHCRHIFFVDEAIPPRTLRLLAEALNNQTLKVNWCGAVRFEKALSDSLLGQISTSGCRMLLYGLESAAEPVMQRMIKGTQREEMSRILRQAASAGIWNHVFFFFGFPGETLADAQETVNFVYAHQDAIHSASPGAFLLERYAPAHRFPEKYGIRQIRTDPRRDLAIYFDYEAERGMDEHTANQLTDRLIEQLPDKRLGQYYVNDPFKLLYASELHRQGFPLPRWIE